MRAALKRWIIRWQLRFLGLAILAQFLLMGSLFFALPGISNAQQAGLGAGQTMLLLMVAAADVIKTDDTTT